MCAKGPEAKLVLWLRVNILFILCLVAAVSSHSISQNLKESERAHTEKNVFAFRFNSTPRILYSTARCAETDALFAAARWVTLRLTQAYSFLYLEVRNGGPFIMEDDDGDPELIGIVYRVLLYESKT